MVSTGIYLRVSTDEQAREGYSIRAQEEKLRAYAIVKDWPIFGIYADEGISGKDIDGRPEIKRLLADVESGKVKNVLVYKIDRLTRSTKNLIELVELFNKHHCAFNSLIESIDTASATGRMFLKIVGIFAEFERENLAERVRLGLERKVKEGYSLCKHSFSYGYFREDGNLIQKVIEDEAVIVRRIFSMYLDDDYSFTKIAKTLNAENISTKMGSKRVQITIRKVLTNCNYIGRVRYGTKDASRYFEVAGHHEPILDENIFYQVQDKISKMKKITRTKRPSNEVYFCGVLRCPFCGGKYTSHWLYAKGKNEGEKTTLKYPSYRCIDAYNGFCDNRGHLSHRKLEAAFEQYVAEIEDLSEHEDSSKTVTSPHDNSAEIAAIAAEVGQIEKKTAEVMSLFMSSSLEFADYQNMVKVGNQRRSELESRLKLLENAQKANEVGFTATEIVTNFRSSWAVLDNEQRQQFVQKFIKKLVVHSEKTGVGKFRNVIIGDLQFNDY